MAKFFLSFVTYIVWSVIFESTEASKYAYHMSRLHTDLFGVNFTRHRPTSDATIPVNVSIHFILHAVSQHLHLTEITSGYVM